MELYYLQVKKKYVTPDVSCIEICSGTALLNTSQQATSPEGYIIDTEEFDW